MSTQVVAHVLFRELVRATPGMDLFARLRLRGEISLEHGEVLQILEETRARLLELEGRGRVHVSDVVREDAPGELLERALGFWNGYHDSDAASLEGNRVVLGDPSLLLYYQNRLVPFAQEIASPDQLDAACQIEHLGAHR